MVRMFPEFNLSSWNPTDFINAWRHIVTRMHADGATNVGFVWNPTEQADGNGTRTKINSTYPGDAYVDWISSDSYNWDKNGAYNACRPGWNEFSWIFNYDKTCGSYGSMERQWGPEKPFFVAETGTKYDTAGVPSGHAQDPNRKKNWFINVESAALSMPYLVGVDFFDQDVHTLEPGNNWRVDSNCAGSGSNCNGGSTDRNTYSGFLSMADSSQFGGGVAGGDS
jgi:beta-mannanase